MPINVICDYYIHKNNLADLSRFLKKWKFLRQISKYFSPLESGNLQLEQTKFHVFWQNFQIPCVFPYRDFVVAILPVFPAQWVPCLSHRSQMEQRQGDLLCC